MINRTQAPQYHSIDGIKLPAINKEVLENGIPVYYVGFAAQDIIKLELVFNAGSYFAEKKGLSALFSKMILGGTSTKSSSEIMEEFDQYGGFVEVNQSVKRLTFTIYGLRKYLAKYLKNLQSVLNESVFPEDELETQKNISKQNLKLSLEKTSVLAARSFKSLIFGKEHPYGKQLEPAHIDDVTRGDLIRFYNSKVKAAAFQIFISGNVGPIEIKTLEDTFGKEKILGQSEAKINFELLATENRVLEFKEKLQSTIRIGKPLFGREHPDFFKMMVCNTAFGGYFGSRLMKKIREEKGYTYGISSSISPLSNFGLFQIASDVVKENTVNTIDEIWNELSILQNEKISNNELETIKNYMCGSFAGSVTTAFDIMSRHKNYILESLPIDFYDTFIERIKSVSREEIQNMAQKHLEKDTMSEVIAGERI